MNYIFISIVASIIAIIYSVYLSYKILRLPQGSEEMKKIAKAIAEGAGAYLKRQNQVVAVVALIIFVVLLAFLGVYSAFAFLIGAFLSALAGFVGMTVAVRTNSRCAHAAKNGLSNALNVAVNGGSVTGLLVSGLALLAVSLTYLYLKINSLSLSPLVSLGLGASLISVFARLGGGIYTKGADVGTDMVGKLEKGIPEDDPRNPGVIADLVGDNVGDDAGMAADLFETYVATMVAVMLLGEILLPGFEMATLFPLMAGAVSLITSIIGTFFVRLDESKQTMKALYKGLIATIVFTAIVYYFFIQQTMAGNNIFNHYNLYLASLIGLGVTLGMVAITEFYTSKKYSSVKKIAQASQSGHGTNVITGLAISMKSTAAPIVLISLAIIVSYALAGLYGIAVATISMLSLTGIVVTIDAFGPITDNAGGIAEMAKQPADVRKVTDALDAVGNTTKAVTKAYAIASAGLASLVLFASYTQELKQSSSIFSFSLSDPYVLIGLFIGGALPYLFASLAMEAVGKAANAIVVEVRRQFREIRGIMEGENKPEYSKAVDIVTKAALREMIFPAVLPIVVPLIVGVVLGPEALGGLLVGTIVTGIFIALSMTTGGAAWDNGKKYIEEGNLGGKGSPAHQAAVTGDTVGDAYKDTAGPAINPMIKVVNIVALLMASFLR